VLLLNSSPNAGNDPEIRQLVDGLLQYPAARDDLFRQLAKLSADDVPESAVAVLEGETAKETPAADSEVAADLPDVSPEPQADATAQPAEPFEPAECSAPAEAPGAEEAVEAKPDLAETLPAEPETRRMRVLAAEDNKTNRLVFSKMVKALNIDLKFAENGLEAVEYWQEIQPDLVFMDISMPKMDGKQATAEIRRLEAETGSDPVPIVAVTAHAMDGDSDAIFAAGVTHYLTKPLKKALILEQIHDALPEGCEALE